MRELLNMLNLNHLSLWGLSSSVVGRDETPPRDSIGELMNEVATASPLSSVAIHANEVDSIIVMSVSLVQVVVLGV